MAQLVAHLHGMQGVRGSSPLRSTKLILAVRGFFCIHAPHLLGCLGLHCAGQLLYSVGVVSVGVDSTGWYHEPVNESLPPCPFCASEYTYEMGALLVCPECAHEWTAAESAEQAELNSGVIKDSVGNILNDGDTVTVTKDLKVKGFPQSIKVGTKVRNIRLVEATDGHDIDCKVDGFGQMQLKSSVVKKVL